MAKKKKDEAKKKKPTTSGLAKKRADDEKRAQAEAEKYYATNSLGRLAPITPTERIAGVAPVSRVSTTMAGGAQSIAQAEDYYTKAQQRDASVDDALRRMMEATGGYTSPEMQSMRENSNRQIMSNSATSARALRASAGANGVTGAAANRLQYRNMRDRNRDLRASETALQAEAAQTQTQRLQNYGSYASNAYNDYNATQSNALKTLLGTRSDVADYQQTGEIANQGADSTDANNTLETQKINVGIDATNAKNIQDTALQNMIQAEKEKSGYLGVLYGDQQVSEARRNQEELEKMQEEQMRIANRGV